MPPSKTMGRMEVNDHPPEAPRCFGMRHVIVIMNFFGVLLTYALRINLSVAIIAMVKHIPNTKHEKNIGEECHTLANMSLTNSTTTPQDIGGTFEWDEYEQGIILSSFFWGYVITQLPGGFLAVKYGAKKLIAYGLLVTIIGTLLTPVAADYGGFAAVVAVRVLCGLGEGFCFPALHSLLSKWSPPLERSRMFTLTYAGTFVAPAVTLPICGYLASSSFLGGWPSIFYVFGGVGIIWFILYMVIVYDTPEQHPFIPVAEKNYLMREIGLHESKQKKRPPIPWGEIVKSVPVWAVLVVHTGHNWFFYTLLTEMPTYMKNILLFDTKQSGSWSSVPYVAMWVISVGAGFLADWVIKKDYVTVTNTRKLANVIGHVVPAAFLIGAGYTGCNQALTVVLITIAVGTNGLSRVGYEVNHLDLSKNYAGVLMGITNCVANIPGILAPYVVGYITFEQQTFAQWRIVFYISAFAAVIPCIFYAFYGSGERQPWDNVDERNVDDTSASYSSSSDQHNKSNEKNGVKSPV